QHLRPTAQFGQFVPLAVRRALRLSDPIGKLFSFCDQLGQLLVLPAQHRIVFAHLRLGVEVEDQGYCQTDGDSGDDQSDFEFFHNSIEMSREGSTFPVSEFLPTNWSPCYQPCPRTSSR